jgi:prolyl-tRNA editing enzyme YbaK/EbsC (Cys-tRNA(Pro) deacylase)
VTDARPTTRRSGSADRVRAYLEEHDLHHEIVTFEQSTKTAHMAADAIGCELGQIVKSLVFVVDGRAAVALVAGDRRGDGDAIATELKGTAARFADADTVREATGFAIGGVSPFDLPGDVPVLVDESLERFEFVYPAAGTPQSIVRIALAELVRLSGGRVARISH